MSDMKLIMENWEKFLDEDLLEEADDFDPESGLPITPAGISKMFKNPELAKRVNAAIVKFVGAQLEPSLKGLPGDLGDLLKQLFVAVVVNGQGIDHRATQPYRLKVLADIMKSISGAPSSQAAPTTSPEKSQSVAPPQDRLKAGLQKILSNPNIPDADKEEAKRDFEEASRKLAAQQG